MQIGALHVRRSAFVAAEPARVWQEFTTPQRVAAWLNRGHDLNHFDCFLDGRVDFSVDIDGQDRHFGGRVVEWLPEQEVSFESQWQKPFDWPVPTYWTIRLTPVNDGTSVELFHHGFQELGAQAGDNLKGYEAGWEANHMEALRSICEGGSSNS